MIRVITALLFVCALELHAKNVFEAKNPLPSETQANQEAFEEEKALRGETYQNTDLSMDPASLCGLSYRGCIEQCNLKGLPIPQGAVDSQETYQTTCIERCSRASAQCLSVLPNQPANWP